MTAAEREIFADLYRFYDRHSHGADIPHGDETALLAFWNAQTDELAALSRKHRQSGRACGALWDALALAVSDVIEHAQNGGQHDKD